MNNKLYSFIVPVFNRPREVKELLESFIKLVGHIDYEILIIEDGSTEKSESIVKDFADKLDIKYYFKKNTGPGDSRNFGMQKASGDYFIILDSDVILPKTYLKTVDSFLKDNDIDCFGGPDAAHSSFSDIQKAIDFAMTSFITTGGIRGKTSDTENFQPRSFNMGISKKAFKASSGFGQIHPGEDPDLVLRLWKMGFKTTLIKDAFVYHKRRISWKKYFNQVYKFGVVRSILNVWHPHSKKITYWFPTLFSIGLLCSIIFVFFFTKVFFLLYLLYFTVAFTLATTKTKSITIGFKSILAILIQFFGYGYGFLKSTFALQILGKTPETHFHQFFYKK